jgi:SpoU rRNA methylase family enzyme
VLPELEVTDAKVDGDDGAFTTTAKLVNSASGVADVVVRVEGADAKQFVDAVVHIAPDAPAEVAIKSEFKPAKIVVDPDVALLFAGRKRCEKSL